LIVLRGFDFQRCRPKLLSVELFQDEDRKKIEDFLGQFHYRLESRIGLSGIFVAE
jgi:hypothetical protein